MATHDARRAKEYSKHLKPRKEPMPYNRLPAKKALTDSRVKELLKDLADGIRRNIADTDEECNVILNVAAVVEHMDPAMVR